MRRFMHKRLILLFAMLLAASPAAYCNEHLYIIANPGVPVDELSTTDVNRIFLLKRITWENGETIIPVNREASSEVREQFSNDVLQASIRSLARYWNQMQYMGHMPPVVQESDAAMIAFIQNVPGSIGYIRAEIPPENVKVLVEIK